MNTELSDSFIDQALNYILPTSWQVIVARNCDLPVTAGNMVDYGSVIDAMYRAYKDNRSLEYDPYGDHMALYISAVTGQTEELARRFVAEVHKHDETGRWTAAKIDELPPPAAINLSGVIAGGVSTVRLLAIAGIVIAGIYFAGKFIPQRRS